MTIIIYNIIWLKPLIIISFLGLSVSFNAYSEIVKDTEGQIYLS